LHATWLDRLDTRDVFLAMSARGRTSFNKRQKEAARRRKQQEKETKRAERAAEKKERDPNAAEEDPDIAGIVPGPQALPEEWGIVEKDEPESDDDEP
jgi:hypothetical protein